MSSDTFLTCLLLTCCCPQKHGDAGAVVPLDPSDIPQQQQALQDMLVAELVHEGRKQLLHVSVCWG
jgi:hypothetical protein